MLIRLMALLALLTLCGCMKHPKPNTELHGAHSSAVRTVANFDRLVMRGPLNASLHTGFKRSQVILKGHPQDIAHVVTRLDGTQLSVIVETGYPKMGRIDADIQTQSLSQIDYKGSGRLSAPALNAPSLNLFIDNSNETSLNGHIGLRHLKVSGPGKVFINGIQSPYLTLDLSKKARVQLAGVINTSQIELKGHAWLSMYWVKSRYLTLRAQDDSFVQLAGAVDTLDACISGKAQFNGRYLRALRSFVKTSDQSIAKINAVKSQHSFATGRSDIYHYDTAMMRSDFMAENGAVLDMRDWLS